MNSCHQRIMGLPSLLATPGSDICRSGAAPETRARANPFHEAGWGRGRQAERPVRQGPSRSRPRRTHRAAAGPPPARDRPSPRRPRSGWHCSSSSTPSRPRSESPSSSTTSSPCPSTRSPRSRAALRRRRDSLRAGLADASRARRSPTPRRPVMGGRAASRASARQNPNGDQSTGLSACRSRYGLVELARR